MDASDPRRDSTGDIFTGAFIHAMWWVAGGLVIVCALMCALPPRTSHAVDDTADQEPAEQAESDARL